jgi:hypothetical protein
MREGPRHSQFTVTLGAASVTVPLTAEFGHLDQPPAPRPQTASPATPVPWWRVLAPVAILVALIVARLILSYLGVA